MQKRTNCGFLCVIFLRVVEMYSRELVSTLQARGKKVFLVSGGFRCLITPIATQLNIPPENIYANRLKFYFTGKYMHQYIFIAFLRYIIHIHMQMHVIGEYAGFDETQPTSRSGGKGEVIRRIKEEKGFNIVVHVGDGSTDLEASPPADAFIGLYNIYLRNRL